MPSDKAGPNPRTSAWVYVVAFLLFGLTTGSAVQLGLVAEMPRLPAETAVRPARGAAGVDTTPAPGELPRGLEGFDSAAYVEGACPVFAGIFATAMAHEVGHTLAALARDVKISIPFLIPNGQLGTFGSITQINAAPRQRTCSTSPGASYRGRDGRWTLRVRPRAVPERRPERAASRPGRTFRRIAPARLRVAAVPREEAQTARARCWCTLCSSSDGARPSKHFFSFFFLFQPPLSVEALSSLARKRFLPNALLCFVRGRPDTDFPDGRRRCRVAAVRRFLKRKSAVRRAFAAPVEAHFHDTEDKHTAPRWFFF